MTIDKLLKPSEARKALGYDSKTTFYRHIKLGLLKPVYVGRLIRASSLPCVGSK